ncbi:hypothetical protein IM697_31340 [Streptomyces ferrugineus]|uniref:Integral membrane protein n=1 Tax=Streptomyces ferrugineus TaxID=1413221 RepID=A0A7M2SHA4_9ACTN|nr:hypothetical protein [Streptomyces ferrugineus]QOV34581.1 hypothetical protein IM697_31340 [Streptomyces ferrugineus]
MAGVTQGATAPRLVRTAMFAAVCAMTTALGHALMADDVLPWWVVGVAFAGTASGAWRLTGREHRAVTIVGATVVAQGLLHLLFSLTHRLVRPSTAVGAPIADRPSGTHGMAFSHSGVGMHHPGAHAPVLETHSGAPFLSAVTHAASAGMLLAHLLAAVACGVWLWRGEAAVHRIGRALAATLFAPLRRVCRVLSRTVARRAAPPCRIAEGAAEDARPTPSALRHAVVRRGPPQGHHPRAHRPSPAPLLAVRP